MIRAQRRSREWRRSLWGVRAPIGGDRASGGRGRCRVGRTRQPAGREQLATRFEQVGQSELYLMFLQERVRGAKTLDLARAFQS